MDRLANEIGVLLRLQARWGINVSRVIAQLVEDEMALQDISLSPVPPVPKRREFKWPAGGLVSFKYNQ